MFLPLIVSDQPEARIRASLGTALLRIPEKRNLLRASAPQFGVAGVLGEDRGDTASADRGAHFGLAHRMTGGELTLGAVLGEREREITACHVLRLGTRPTVNLYLGTGCSGGSPDSVGGSGPRQRRFRGAQAEHVSFTARRCQIKTGPDHVQARSGGRYGRRHCVSAGVVC
jgi:hypothetical protein